ncbi:MAG: D-glycero-beta-D-manno-heptose 1,7-bisphosphate 7-phosphatase [Chloroflexi bacterium]|nr:D-glycero-beta-D-manno-heptose 1,7-bisphosphate 7-phosphatase [Chloroflexota bacterium]
MRFVEKYLKDVKQALSSVNADEVSAVIDLLCRARVNGNKIITMGNGGSASTATHFVNGLSQGATVEGESRFRAVALTDNIPNLLAYANDFGYENIFVEQLRNLMEEGDVVIGISGSGNSENVIRAIAYARENSGVTVGLCGFDGGKLKGMVDYPIHVPSTNMEIVEDVHLAITHLIASCLRNEQPACEFKKAVFLDRDGVVNREKGFTKSWEEFEFLPGITEGIKKLNQAGFLVIIVTNQSGINKGLYTEEDLKQIHENMHKVLEENGAHVDDLYYCPHNSEDCCTCRKPKPGMLLEAAHKHNINLRESWVLGDNIRDIEAGKRARCNTILVEQNGDIGRIIERIVEVGENRKQAK